MARLLLAQDEIDKSRELWIEKRLKGITASEIAAILGLAPSTHGSPFALFTAKTQGEDWRPDNDAMMRGRYLEPYVADVFSADHPYLHLMPAGLYCHPDREWQLATFDRLALDTAVRGLPDDLDHTDLAERYEWDADPVQIKTAISKNAGGGDPLHSWGEPYTSQIPIQYRAQVLWEMDVQEAERAWVPCLFMQEWKVVTYLVERDGDAERDMEFMRAAAEEFRRRLRDNDPPDVDFTPATTEALKAVYKYMDPDLDVPVTRKLARRYLSARKAVEREERRRDQALNELRRAIGPGRRAVIEDAGRTHTVVTRSQYPAEYIDVKRLRREQPDIARQYTKKVPVDKMIPGRWGG